MQSTRRSSWKAAECATIFGTRWDVNGCSISTFCHIYRNGTFQVNMDRCDLLKWRRKVTEFSETE